MALFDKLFSLKRRLDSENFEPRRDRGRSCQINPEQVRLLLFKECDWRGRRLLFDSSAIDKVPDGKNDKPTKRKTDETPCIVEVSNGYAYVYKGPEADASVLGEMIFGAVAMNCKSVSLKIHIMDEPRRLMCTKVFCVPVSRRISRADRKTSDRVDAGVRSASKPLNVPDLREEGVSLSFSLDRGDSGFYGDHSPYSSVSSTCDYFSLFGTWDGEVSQEDFSSFHSLPGRKLSASSNSSWQRRTFQNLATRFDLGQSSQLLNLPARNATGSDSQIYSNSSTSGTCDSLASGASMPQRKNKLGLAVLITVADSNEMDLVRRCAEHSPQMAALVCRVRRAAQGARAGGFVSALHAAAADAARWLSDLIYGARVQPMWLSLVTQEPRASHKLAESLLADLCSVLAVGDTKTTHFFISTLLTHVLTYHLGWVTTVSPYDTIDHPPPSEARPYNALWAQLSDLCGTIGFPPRAARTILTGDKNHQFINRLLLVLTYFIRCGDVTKNIFQYRESVIREVKTVNVNEVLRTPQKNATNTHSDSSVSTLIASELSFKRSATRANLSQQLSTAEGGNSSGEKSSGLLKRNPTMMHSMKSSDSSLNSTNSDGSMPDQKVLFVLGDDEKLVGLKNKSNGGKMVKKSSKASEPPGTASEQLGPASEPLVIASETLSTASETVGAASETLSAASETVGAASETVSAASETLGAASETLGAASETLGAASETLGAASETLGAASEQAECVKARCDRNLDSPSKCCAQTLQHSKPIKHSGYKFEFDKYPQIVTNYMKSKNLEILDRHYIGKPGNLKLDNFQFDPTIVPPIQEERCETCVKCQMESMLQTPTNASEMEYMNDMPRALEPQYADQKIVTELDTRREMSPKTFVRKRKDNTIVVNLRTNAKSVSDGEVNRATDVESDRMCANFLCNTLLPTIPFIKTPTLEDPTNLANDKLRPKTAFRSTSKLKATKSLGNLSLLISETDDEDSSSDWKISSNVTLHLSSNDVKPIQNVPVLLDDLKTIPSKSDTQSTISSNQESIEHEISSRSSSNDKSSILSNEVTTFSKYEDNSSQEKSQSNLSLQESIREVEKSLAPDQTVIITPNEEKTDLNPTPIAIKPTLLELKMPEPRRTSRDTTRTVEVKRVIEFPLPKIYSTEDTMKSGFDASLLGGVTDHYVPDLVLQGTLAKPFVWESELRRDLELTSYLNKGTDAPVQAVAIIGDTNTWEVRVVGRGCGSGGMSSLVGAMLDALPAMWKAKVPAHQCISFLESKLREFCVLSKTLANMLMSTDFCDIATLTKSLNIDVSDVPLLLAVATTHTPQVATRYGLSYR